MLRKLHSISAFNYPYKGIEANRVTGSWIVCIFWFIVFSIKYDGVDVAKRGAGKYYGRD